MPIFIMKIYLRYNWNISKYTLNTFVIFRFIFISLSSANIMLSVGHRFSFKSNYNEKN